MGYLVAGVVTASAIIFLLLKLDFKKVLYFEILVDLAATIIFVIMFSGSYSGEMAAVSGAAFFSIFLYVSKRTIGYKKPSRLYTKWTEVPGAWTQKVRHV